MTCHEFDWKGYVLDEVSSAERPGMEEHLSRCAACGQDLEALRLTLLAMKRLPVVDVPRRIAFVSDPVFEPSWWQRFLSSGPKLGFASAAMLSLAIVGHGLVSRPLVVQVPAAAVQVAREDPSQVSAEQIRTQVLAEISAKLAAQERQAEMRRQADLADVKSAFDVMNKRWNTIRLSTARYGGD